MSAPDIARSGVPLAPARPVTARLSRALPWIGIAILFVVLPKIFASGGALTALCLMGVMIVFASSYNMLLGQTGLLSFGHAVYYGLAGYVTIHAMNAVIAHKWPIPLPVLPIVGGIGGLCFGLLFGAISTKRAGTIFAMISLGLGELVAAAALALHAFFGGEAGITTNRAKLMPFFGYRFGPQIEVYYLIAFWCFVAILAMYAITRTPFGRMCNAVRENPERAEFVGYSTRRVRFIAFSQSAFFAGIAGALAAINFEIVNSQSVGAQQSGLVLLMTFFGGAGFFAGPIVGAAIITLLQLVLADISGAWMLYFGLLFIFVVMYAPGGVAGWVMQHAPVARAGKLGRLAPAYALAAVPLALLFVGAVLAIELLHHQLVEARSQGSAMRLAGIDFDAAQVTPWFVALALLAAGLAFLRFAWPRVTAAWGTVHLEMKD